MNQSATDVTVDLDRRIDDLLADHAVDGPREEFLGARFDAGLAYVHMPVGCGGLGLSQVHQLHLESRLAEAGAPDTEVGRNGIGHGMVFPTIVQHGNPDQHRTYLRRLFTNEDMWCQLFSEPGAGSDLAAVATKAVRDGDQWVVNGQKVWTSNAHHADWAILVARTDNDVPKHAGLTYFLCPMKVEGVDVRPLRQITGEAEFNEVFLTDVRIDDSCRLGDVGNGWRVAMTTLNNERVAIGGSAAPRESGMIGVVAAYWRDHPEAHTPALQDRLVRLWAETEAIRLAGERLRQQWEAGGQPGPEGSALKLAFARTAQEISGLGMELEGENGLRYDDWTMVRPEGVDFTGRGPGYRYLRAKGNSIEGGTTEILKNVIAERVLGLPPEPRVDKDIPWKDLPR